VLKNIIPAVKRNGGRPARGIVIVNNTQVRFNTFDVEQNGFSAADTFEIELPFFIRNQQTGDLVLANGPEFQSVLLTQDVIPVQVYVGYPKNPLNYGINDLVQLIDGTMDTARWDFDNTGEYVTLNGRNVVGKMIDAKITDKFPNQTASSIAESLADKYSLSKMITPTTTLAGTYYSKSSAMTGDSETTEWDLLQYLAQQEGFVVRVKNNTLMFGAYSDITGYEGVEPIVYTWGYDVEKLEIERSPHAARDIVVKVISYDRRTKTRIYETKRGKTETSTSTSDTRVVATADSTTERSLGTGNQVGRKEQYVETYTIPGLTRDQAQKKAQAIYEQLSRSQLIGQIDCAGNTDMAIDRLIQIQGIGLGLQNNYYLNKVSHKFDIDNGYSNECSFSNQFMSDENAVEQDNTSGSDSSTSTE
jgi:phage protein D